MHRRPVKLPINTPDEPLDDPALALLHATDALDAAEAAMETAMRACASMDERTPTEVAAAMLERLGAAQRAAEAARAAFDVAQDAQCPEADTRAVS